MLCCPVPFMARNELNGPAVFSPSATEQAEAKQYHHGTQRDNMKIFVNLFVDEKELREKDAPLPELKIS